MSDISRKEKKEVIEANIIFAVKLQNPQSVPKIILLLDKIRVIVALQLKKTPRQYMQYEEWTHKCKNCTK